ncbi:MAG: winged helix-turn-helix transcriptional regulator [Candidatus Thorarchaeota archaeon]|nr:winged helix-turn-helix transcriptional regulator [Candidatus Thorarchaeota archaeon]
MSAERTSKWMAEFHAALANPVRLQIIDYLMDGERCQCDILPKINMSQSVVSSYLTRLVKAGVLSVRRDGTRKLYSIKSPEVRALLQQSRALAEVENTP